MESATLAIGNDASRKGLRLLTYISPKLPEFVIGDCGRIEQIITTLLSYAIERTVEGQVVIRVETAECNVDGNVTIRFSVVYKNNGIGDDLNSRNLQISIQGEPSPTRELGLTEPGLAIAKSLAKMMGGEIGVHSNDDETSEFRVSIPFSQCDKQLADSAPTDFSGLRFLLVNKNPTEQAILQQYIEHWNAGIDLCTELEDILDLCRGASEAGAPYDAVVLGPVGPRRYESIKRRRSSSRAANSVCIFADWQAENRTNRFAKRHLS